MKIDRLSGQNALDQMRPGERLSSGAKSETIGASFARALQSLSEMEHRSDSMLSQLAAGDDVDIHQVMINLEETDISFRIALGIRDRLVEAYREIMRMSV